MSTAYGSEGFLYEAPMEPKYTKASTYITNEKYNHMDGVGEMITNASNLGKSVQLTTSTERLKTKDIHNILFLGPSS